MATRIKIKRSSANPTATPSSVLGQGELAYAEGTSTYSDAAGGSVTSYGKLFVGKGSETGGVAAGLDIIGGKYFTDMLDHQHGTIVANKSAVVDSDKKVNEWFVDNLKLDSNTISSTNSNGDILFDTNGNGDYSFAGATTVGTNLFKITDGSTNRFVVDSFSGNVDITTPALSAADTVLNISSTWNNASNKFDAIKVNVTNTASANTSLLMDLQVGGASKFKVGLDGTVTTTGDFDLTGDVTIGGTLGVTGETTLASAIISDLTDNRVLIAGTSGAVEDSANLTFNGSTLAITGAATVSTNLTVTGDIAVNGADLTTTATTFNLLETNATTVNAFGAATAIDIGATSGTATINNPTVVGTQTTQNLWNTVATTVNFAGAANIINMGTNVTTLDLGYIRIKGNTISTDSNSATELIIDPFPDSGDAGGDVIIRGNLQVAGTTTTVNSTEMSVNDPLFTVGDSVSSKTVQSAASSGQNTLVIDNPSSVVEGATITAGSGLAGGTTISNVRIEWNVGSNPLTSNPSAGANIYFFDGTSFSLLGTFVSKTASTVTIDLAANISTSSDDFYNGNSLTTQSSGTPTTAQKAAIQKVDTKVFKTTTLTLSANTNGSLAVGDKVTIAQATDDNLDRGIVYKTLIGNAAKTGFFGYDDSTTYFTFIADATNNAGVIGGSAGKAQFNTVKIDTGVNKGVAYYNGDLELTRTVAAGTSDITTSHKILTSNGATGEPIWTTTVDGGTY